MERSTHRDRKGKSKIDDTTQNDIDSILLASSLDSLLFGDNQLQNTKKNGSYSPSPEERDGCIIHEVRPSDTLVGIALRYGVDVAEIKLENRMWGNQELFAKRTLIIPSKKGVYLSNEQKEKLIHQFMEETSKERDLALYYLKGVQFKYAEALRKFENDKINNIDIPISKNSPLLRFEGSPLSDSSPTTKVTRKIQNRHQQTEQDLYEL
eukprot:TRINITY_DN20393_c0_g1_i1.p1 TRINITY_DN20393_c0_g1~~TRINITY_DN20393_c0_g1_i1.p1  ORF type:complete len:209 (+),score=36.85 TRINITY_DN20393_c0_g1_i1:144-770(+)